MQGSLRIEPMCRLSGVSRAGFYRSLQERMPVEEAMEPFAVLDSRASRFHVSRVF
jgi:predicted DNA-binding transcriptional regulator AlpA